MALEMPRLVAGGVHFIIDAVGSNCHAPCVRKAGAVLAAAGLTMVVGNEVCQRLLATGFIGPGLFFSVFSFRFSSSRVYGIPGTWRATGLGLFSATLSCYLSHYANLADTQQAPGDHRLLRPDFE